MSRLIRGIIFFGFLFFCFCGCHYQAAKKVCFRNNCIIAEVAASASLRIRGLMFRKGLAPDRGMLLVYKEESRHAVWMKNMNFALDIIWIDRHKKIVDIYRNALPCKETCGTISSAMNSQFILEVNAGFVEKNQIRIGERVSF